MRDLDDAEFERYARHLILDEVGEEGQAKLLAARVLVVGAGGLGSPLLLYLAAAGVGTLGIVDDDAVSLSNLQRQVLHRTADIGRRKTDSAADALKAIEPAVTLELWPERLTAANIDDLVGRYDLIADGSDNFATRYLVNDACVRASKPFVSGALLRFEGQLSVFKPHAGPAHPCYRCLFPDPPDTGAVPRCEAAGILGPVAGVIGTLQATEVLKELLGIGLSLSGRLMLYDALATSVYTVRVPRDPHCPCCGTGAS